MAKIKMVLDLTSIEIAERRDPEVLRQEIERARSNAAGTMEDQRTKRLRTRSKKNAQAIRDSRGW